MLKEDDYRRLLLAGCGLFLPDDHSTFAVGTGPTKPNDTLDGFLILKPDVIFTPDILYTLLRYKKFVFSSATLFYSNMIRLDHNTVVFI